MDPEITKRLLALPSLREQAESEYASRVQTQVQDLAMQRAARLRGTEIEARLIASMDWYGQAWALREIGRLLGWVHGDICLVPGKNDTVYWAVEYRFPDGTLVARYSAAPSRHNHHVPGLPADRPGAIAAILLHLSGVK
jgi:hypothetical protein